MIYSSLALPQLLTRGGDACSTRGLIKVDLLATEGEGLLNEITFGPSHVGGEATFVPRDADALLRRECDEDDGYLIVYVTDFANPANLRSSCWVRYLRSLCDCEGVCRWRAAPAGCVGDLSHAGLALHPRAISVCEPRQLS